MDYTEIVSAAQMYADRQDFEVNQSIDIFILMAEARINRKLKTYEQTHRIFTSTKKDQEFYALPDDYNGMRAIQYNTGLVDEKGTKSISLEYVTPETLVDYQLEQKGGYYYSIVGQQIQVHPILPTGGTLELLFYRKVPNLNSQSKSNWCSNTNPDIYISGLCAEIELFVKNYDASQLWDQRMSRAIKELSDNDFDNRWAGNPLQMRAE